MREEEDDASSLRPPSVYRHQMCATGSHSAVMAQTKPTVQVQCNNYVNGSLCYFCVSKGCSLRCRSLYEVQVKLNIKSFKTAIINI